MQGRDVSAASMALLRERCPELLEHFAFADVFPSAGGGAEAMAAAFGVPFFGRVRAPPRAAHRYARQRPPEAAPTFVRLPRAPPLSARPRCRSTPRS